MKTSLHLGDAEVPRTGLGTNRLSSTEEHVAFLRAAVNEGIGHIDTAHLYAGGDSETTIGAALSPLPPNLIVATKGGFRPGEGRPEVLQAQVDERLRRLRTDTIGLCYSTGSTPKRRSRRASAPSRSVGTPARRTVPGPELRAEHASLPGNPSGDRLRTHRHVPRAQAEGTEEVGRRTRTCARIATNLPTEGLASPD
jgi:hypothetical protein